MYVYLSVVQCHAAVFGEAGQVLQIVLLDALVHVVDLHLLCIESRGYI